ncbi:hypothetical protein ACFQ7O_24015 [Streptomyces sp. NPDC056485]|uniref:hypothetical protein n=1 Tax=Streptomyces sp. NPDC056485 TaxID=3345834 RepID=UPI0036739381
MTTGRTATEDLTTIATLWPYLQEALGTPNTTAWPPAGLRDYLQRLDRLDREDARGLHYQRLIHTRHATGQPWYECVDCAHVGDGREHPVRPDRDPAQLGERPSVMAAAVADTMRVVTRVLVGLADRVAESVQRQPMAGAPADWQARGWSEQERDQRDELARDDAADVRRWRRASARPNGQHAALWLLARAQGAPGPFGPLSAGHRREIERAAAGAAGRVERTLDIGDQSGEISRPCRCGGVITVHSGTTTEAYARCDGCGKAWTLADAAAA